jgi:CRISPR-associated protein Csd2
VIDEDPNDEVQPTQRQGGSQVTAIPPAHTNVERRHDFILLFDVQDGNPNGDPDAGNLPRIDPETMQGLVTDVSLKRRVRDWVDAVSMERPRYKIYVQRESYLTETRGRVFEEQSGGRQGIRHSEAQEWMCREFFDVRMFGAVMSMREYNAGQVRGPVQLTFARSVDSIFPSDSRIARVALERRGERQEGREDDELAAPTHGTLGRKYTVPYGLYLGYGFFSPHFARRTGVTDEDLEMFWSALVNMWDLDRSASRGLMACRGLYVFSHESPLGNAPAHRLFEHIIVRRNDEVEVPRKFGDYTVTLSEANLPASITLTVLEGCNRRRWEGVAAFAQKVILQAQLYPATGPGED